jgi:alpha-1,2-mannosyltransferase
VITLLPPNVLDVGTASALGANRILHGHSIYYATQGHPDTYGPLAYLVYAPFMALSSGFSWAYLLPVREAAIAFDLLTVAGLIWFGVRLRGGRSGWRLGLLLAWLWAACPFTVLGMEKSTNDGLVALIVVAVMLVLSSPLRRGILVGLGAASKFFPAALLPLVAIGPGNEPRTAIRRVLAGFVIATGVSFAVFLPSGGVQEVWNHTLGYQLTRSDIFSIWALHPWLAPLKDAVELAAVLLTVAVALRPRGARTPAQVAALAAAVTIALQLPALHWFYMYIAWFFPLVLIAALAGGQAGTDDSLEDEAAPALGQADAAPVLAGTA